MLGFVTPPEVSKSFTDVQQRWTPMQREAHGLYEGCMELEHFTKGYKKFIVRITGTIRSGRSCSRLCNTDSRQPQHRPSST